VKKLFTGVMIAAVLMSCMSIALTITGNGTGSGTIAGTMAFDRKEYGMNSGIPFIKIADRVEVSVNLRATRVSGSPVALK